MLIVSGTLLVVATWIVAGFVVVSLGLLVAVLAAKEATRPQLLRSSLWWGLLVAVVFAYLVNLATPLQSATAGWALVAVTALLGVPGWWLWTRRAKATRTTPISRWLLVGTIAVAIALAVAALGPVTNYDSGLYHLQAIRYAAEYATVPGLGSVFFPLGYGNAEFPLAALMGAGVWGFEGFRLLNGLLIVLGLLDLVLRSRSRATAGFYVLLTGLTVVAITMVPLTDYWVTSPTQDSSVFLVTMVAAAYLADLVSRTKWVPEAATAVALIIVVVLMRPTMIAFAALVVACMVVVAVKRWKQTETKAVGRVAGVAAAATVIAAIAAVMRDYVLTGWLQYPLSILPFDVDWRVLDPTNPRTATLGAARNGDDLWNAAVGWDWIGVWVARMPQAWEFWAFVLLVVTAVVLLVWAGRTATRTGLAGRQLVLTMIPSAGAVAFWWLVTPPAFRFAWGPLFSLAVIPIGWALWRLHRAEAFRLPRNAVLGASVVMVAVAILTLAVRIDYSTMSAHPEGSLVKNLVVVSPITAGDVAVATNGQGLQIRYPFEGEQCWTAFPTCSPQMLGTLRLRGTDIQSGYLP